MGWKGLSVLSVIFFGLAGFILQSGLQFEADKAAALQGQMPEVVPLDAFDATRDVHLAQEVHVRGQINPEYNYTLTEHHTGKGPDYDVVRRMFVLFGPADAADAKMARAVVLLREDQVDAFVSYTAENAVEFTDQGFSFALNGAADTVPELEDMADDALAKEGLTKAPNFVFIEPWLHGRAAALAPKPDVPWGAAGMVSVPAAVFLLMAVWRKRRGAYVAPVAPVLAAPAVAAPITARMRSTTGKVVLGYVAMFVALWMGVWWAGPAMVFLTMVLIVRGIKRGIAAGGREVMALGRNVQEAMVARTTPVADAVPVLASSATNLPPAIRSGFRFADLIPKRADKPVPMDDAYARLAASIGAEHLRKQGA
jgi:hypothetical protein